MHTVVKRLTKGQDVLFEIEKLLEEHNITAGVVLSAVGSLSKSKIRVPVIDGIAKYIQPRELEIISLQGTMSVNGCHIHIAVADSNGTVLGGHLMPGCTVRTTCELVIGILEDTTFERMPDTATGFDELSVS